MIGNGSNIVGYGACCQGDTPMRYATSSRKDEFGHKKKDSYSESKIISTIHHLHYDLSYPLGRTFVHRFIFIQLIPIVSLYPVVKV